MDTNLVEIFYIIDEFCKEIEKTMEGHILRKDTSKKKQNKAFTMSDSEVITIMIMFHQSRFRDMKAFYIHIQRYHQQDFPHTVSYNRFCGTATESACAHGCLPATVLFGQMYRHFLH